MTDIRKMPFDEPVMERYDEDDPSLRAETEQTRSEALSLLRDADGAFLVIIKDAEIFGLAFGPDDLPFAVMKTVQEYLSSCVDTGVLELGEPDES